MATPPAGGDGEDDMHALMDGVEDPRAVSASDCLFRRKGDCWAIGRPGAVVLLRDRVGLHHLAALLREPGRELAAVDPARCSIRGRSASTGGASMSTMSGSDATRGDDPHRNVLPLRARSGRRRGLAALSAATPPFAREEPRSQRRHAFSVEFTMSDRGAR